MRSSQQQIGDNTSPISAYKIPGDAAIQLEMDQALHEGFKAYGIKNQNSVTFSYANN